MSNNKTDSRKYYELDDYEKNKLVNKLSTFPYRASDERIVGEEYRLTIPDALKLQGFENYELIGTQTANWKMLGNTIPTIFTKIIGKQILKML